MFCPIHSNKKKTVAGLFKSESMQKQHSYTHLQIHNKDVLKDIWDGKVIANNALLKSDPMSLGLILYQDSFEVVNPLGSGRKKQSACSLFHIRRHFTS